jgi:hypothetical protein
MGEDELPGLWLEPLLEDWELAGADAKPAHRHATTAERKANDRMVRNVMKNPCLQV